VDGPEQQIVEFARAASDDLADAGTGARRTDAEGQPAQTGA
jgi:hypothetical protein